MSDVSKCFFWVSISGSKPQKIVFELFKDICPNTCKNFLSFCESDDNIKTYRGTFFHRIIPGFMVQGGDYENHDGSGGSSFDGGKLLDESFAVKHSEPGILSMANRGKDTGGSQFFITTGKASHLDGKHVAFGRVIEGMNTVYDMEKVETDEKDKPIFQKVKIVDCGVGDGDVEDSDDDSDSQIEISRHKSSSRKKHFSKNKSRKSNSTSSNENESTSHSSPRKRKHRKRKKHKKKNHRKDDYSGTSSSRSDDDSYERHNRKKRSKRHKHKRKRRKYDSDNSTDSSRDNKSRKRDHKKRSQDSSSRAPPTEITFGKYGIIREADLMNNSRIKRSFEIWLEEVKHIPSGSNMSKSELSNYFKDYAEDFNTATLPHQKYYDYDKWEMQEYIRQKEESHAKSSILADEFEHREQMKRKAEEKKRKEFETIKLLMSKDKVEDMKNQARLKAELTNAYRVGDEETRKRLQKRLENDDK